MLIHKVREYYAISCWLKGYDKKTIARGFGLTQARLSKLTKPKTNKGQRAFIFSTCLHKDQVSSG